MKATKPLKYRRGRRYKNDRPKDFPDYFVVRRFINDQPQDLLAVCSTLKAVREHIPPGLICLARSPTDEPQIVETWV